MECIQRRATKLWGVWSTSVMGSSWGSWDGSIWRRGASGEMLLLSIIHDRRLWWGGPWSLLWVTAIGQEGMASSCARGGSGWILAVTSPKKQWCTGTGCPRSGGVTIPGGVPETCRCGTWGHSLVGKVVGRWMLGLGDHVGLFQPQQFYDCMILCGIRGLEEEIPQGGELHFRIKVNPSECFPVAPSWDTMSLTLHRRSIL